jgi:hypothetical protein
MFGFEDGEKLLERKLRRDVELHHFHMAKELVVNFDPSDNSQSEKFCKDLQCCILDLSKVLQRSSMLYSRFKQTSPRVQGAGHATTVWFN